MIYVYIERINDNWSYYTYAYEYRNILKDKNKILSALKCEQVMICLDSKSNMNTIIKMIIIT